MPGPYLAEDDARRLWRRAAELQAEAARRLEERSRSLARDGEETRADPGAPEGYALEHVRAAALEAGIGEEFVRQAVAELQAGAPAARPGRSDGVADAFLGKGPRAVVVSRVFDAPAERVLEVLEKVLPSHPFELVLREGRGGPLVEGGVLIFDVPQVKSGESGTFAHDMRIWSDLTEVHLSVRRVGEQRCEVTLASPLDRARRINLWVGGGVTAVLGSVAGVAAGVAGGSLAWTLGLAPLVIVLVAGLVGLFGFAGTGAALAAVAFRPLYRWAVGKGGRSLGRILQSVAVHLETGGAFSPAVRGKGPARISDGS